MKHVRDIMTEIVQFIAPETSVREALVIFDEAEIRHLPILREETLVGFISDRDVRALQKVYQPPGEDSILDSPVRDYMHADVVSIGPDATIVSAIDMIKHMRVGAVPVLSEESKELIGIVSYIDILDAARGMF